MAVEVKHDAARVMELHGERQRINEPSATIAIEDKYLYPMLKSSDLARSADSVPYRWMLVPQRRVADDTSTIARDAPLTWAYLQTHADILDARKSSIYAKAPRFSIFGVGDYTFKPWKVAISGLYRSFSFRLVPPVRGRPVVFDDTCYFLSWDNEEQAAFAHSLLTTTAHGPRIASVLGLEGAYCVLDSLNLNALAALLANRTITLLSPPEMCSPGSEPRIEPNNRWSPRRCAAGIFDRSRPAGCLVWRDTSLGLAKRLISRPLGGQPV
jgi:hypothetical protein